MQFLLIFGPPAVGKMAVGMALEEATGIRLFHNHLSIEPVLRFFPFGSAAFRRLVDGFRTNLFQEAARSELPGLAFTYVWDLDSDADNAFVAATCRIFEQAGAEITLVELVATLEVRLLRNRSEQRLREKPSKRDVLQSEQNLLNLEKHRLNSAGTLPLGYRHLVIDNSHASPKEVADAILASIGFGRVPGTENA